MASPRARGLSGLLLLLCLVFQTALGLHDTDTITSAGDNTRSGHMPNHNMEPNVVKSGSFDMIWRTKGMGNYKGFNEQFYAQPLIYTPPGKRQSVYAISQQNYAYRFDAVTGELLNYRQLMIPFLVADIDGCNDISDCIGSTATGVIDPTRNAWYVTTKTYANQNSNQRQGLLAGRYWIHALDVITLEEKPGFPVPLEGIAADNAPWRVFQGGKHHQRPALMQVGDFVYAGFASHCVQYNFTGWVIGWHAGTGELVSKFATEGGREANGKGGGIWMSGGGLASDNPGRMFFASGNGYASQLADDPVPGRQPPTALEEAVVNMAINGNGSLTPTDFFMPWEKRDLDGMDKDLGTSGFILLEPDVFSTSKVQRIGCVAGKTGKFYFLNLDDLGGYQMGPNRKDDVLQVTQLPNAVFASAGTYPFEGGYVYVTPIGFETIAFKFGRTTSGDPVFTMVGKTTESAAGRQGVGHSTITSMKGEPGSGILWILDVEGVTLRAYGTIPVNGILPTYALLNSDSQSKFSRPSFGNGKVYVGSTNGYITAFGSPVNMPLNCSAPYDAGTVNLGNSTLVNITCIAFTPLQVDTIGVDLATHFSVTDLPALPYTMILGGTISFKAKFEPKSVGPLSTNINLRTTNQVGRFSPNTPVVIRGKSISQNPVLRAQPTVLSFGEIITGSEAPTLPFSLKNGGLTPLQVIEYKWSFESSSGPWITPNSSTTVGAYTFTNLPGANTSIPAEQEHIVSVSLDPPTDGYWVLYLVIITNGGTATVGIFGTSGGSPVAKIEWQLSNGTWIEWNNSSFVVDGGTFRGQKQNRKMRLSNIGGTTLTTTISKPPVSGPLAAINPLGSIAEGSQIRPGKFEEATIVCSPPKGQVNMDPELLTAVWTLNNNDPTFGKHTIVFECSAKTPQHGDLDGNGQGYHRYLGCYRDADPNRRMSHQAYSLLDNTNKKCIIECKSKPINYAFVATEYERECWCGTTAPPTKVPDTSCNYLCSGDFNEYCGGDGTLMSVFYDRRLWTPDNGTIPNPTSTSASSISTAPSGSPTSSPGYKSLGCAFEGTGGRALTGGSKFSTTMTPQECQGYCTSLSFSLSGVEYSTECYCGNTLSNGATLGSPNCNMPCGGDSSQICGGPSALSLFERNSTSTVTQSSSVSPTSSTPTSTSTPIPDYKYLGCASEGIGGRALTGGFRFLDSMTPELCQSYCSSISLPLSGVEYSKECYCGMSLSNGAALGSTRCNMPCGGDASKICGGPSALSLYRYSPSGSNSSSASVTPPATSQASPSSPSSSSISTPTQISNYEYLGCAFEGMGDRALIGGTLFSDTMTPQMCQTHCTSLSFRLSGVEYSTECFCGNTLSNGATIGSSNCNMACGGDSTKICGGPSALSLFRYLASNSSWSSISPSSVSPIATSSIASVSPSADPNYNYLGCASEGTDGRALIGGFLHSETMTPGVCQQYCTSLNLKLSGVEYSTECYCGNALANSAALGSTKCTMACGGDMEKKCGGPSALSLFEYVPVPVSSSAPPPSSSVVSSVPPSSTFSTSTTPTSSSTSPSSSVPPPESTAFQYLGCATEGIGGHALTLSTLYSSQLTPQLCQEYCTSLKLPLSGVGYSQECHCGLELSNNATLGSGACTMACAGDANKQCGGPSVLSVYNWTQWQSEPELERWTDFGCWLEGIGERALKGQVKVEANMTLGSCMRFCEDGEWEYAGVEYATECYCGDALAGTAVLGLEKECGMLCGGGGGVCGGEGRLSVYKKEEVV